MLRDSWRDPQFAGPPLRSVLVIGVGRSQSNRYTTAYTTVPPSIEQWEVLTIESTLWDMRPDRVVWSGTSESTDVKDVATLTGELAAVLIAKMKEDKIL